MQQVGKLIKMEIMTKEVKLDSLNKLVMSLERLSNLVSIENMRTRVRVSNPETDTIPLNKKARISKVALRDNNVCWMYRDYPLSNEDSGWRIYNGEEDDEYMDDKGNFVEMSLLELIAEDNRLTEVIHAPVGTQYEWFDEFNKFIELE